MFLFFLLRYMKIDFSLLLFIIIVNMYTRNEFAIVENKNLQMFQQYDYESIKSEYEELVDLCDIFSRNENQSKKLTMFSKKQLYHLKYDAILKEKKRILENTKKRFKYNFEKALANESI
jgi:hypothetical protein